MLTNCFRFAPRDSVPGLIAKICKYLKDHPGWSEEELEEQIKQFIGQTGVESFNGRTGAVVLSEDDVNKLKIASAYFAEGDENIDELDLVSLYNQGVRFVFTNWNSVTSGYDLAFVLDYFSGSNDVVYYPMATGSGGGGNIVSVNGKTGIVELSLSDILGDSGAQVKLCTATEFTSTTLTTWNAYYEEGYRIVGVVNSDASAIDYIYLLKQDENNHQPIGLSTGASDAYTPTNPPPYPVTSVNGKTGAVTGLYDAENPPPYPVASVNGKTGVVTGLYDSENPPPYPVKTVNNEKGDVLVTKLLSVDVDQFYTRYFFNAGDNHGLQVGSGSSNAFNIIKHFGSPIMRYWLEETNKNGDFYTTDNQPPYPVTSVNGLTGDVTLPMVIKTAYAPVTAESEQYDVTVPANSLLFIFNVLLPFTESTSTLPAGNEDGITLVKTGTTISARDMVISFKLVGYNDWHTSFISDSQCIVNYKNTGSSAISLHYGPKLGLINPSNEEFVVTIKGYY